MKNNVTVELPKNCHEIEAHASVGRWLEFNSKKAKKSFTNRLLENAAPTAVGSFYDACWKQLKNDHPDWSEEKFEYDYNLGWTGGCFFTLPSVEFLQGGIILFCSAKQLNLLKNKPWICEGTSTSDMGGEYIALDDIDYIVALDDTLVESIEKEASEDMMKTNGKLYIYGKEIQLKADQKPRTTSENFIAGRTYIYPSTPVIIKT